MGNGIDMWTFLGYILIMAATTYLIRAVPLLLIKKKIENRFLRSFLYYMPYAVLAVMTVPAIFYCTANIYSAIAGFAVALTLALCGKKLGVVAVFACCTVFAVELIMSFIA